MCVWVSQQRLPEPFSGDGFGLWRLGAEAKGGMLVMALVEVTWVTCHSKALSRCGLWPEADRRGLPGLVSQPFLFFASVFLVFTFQTVFF